MFPKLRKFRSFPCYSVYMPEQVKDENGFLVEKMVNQVKDLPDSKLFSLENQKAMKTNLEQLPTKIVSQKQFNLELSSEENSKNDEVNNA